MGSEGKRRYLGREEGAPAVHGEGISLDVDEVSLGSGGVDKGEGWVEWSG